MQFLNENFKLCKAINGSDQGVDDLINYFTGIIVNGKHLNCFSSIQSQCSKLYFINSFFFIKSVAMTDYPNPSNFLKPMPKLPMKEICKILNTDQLNDPDLVQLFKTAFFSIYLNYTGNAPECIDLDADSTDLGADGWNYQSCTETVMPICSNGVDDFFEVQDFNLTAIESECKAKFGVQLDPNKVRMEYGLKDLRAATNVVFSNGARDPWSAGKFT